MSDLVRKAGEVKVITLADSVCPPPSERLPVNQFQRMLSAGERSFLLEFKQSWVDAAMLGHVVTLWREVQRVQGVLKIVVSPDTKKILDGIQGCPFKCFESEEEARTSFRQSEE